MVRRFDIPITVSNLAAGEIIMADQWEIEENSYEDILKRFSGKTNDNDSDSDYQDEEDEDEETNSQTHNITEHNAMNGSYESVLNPSRDFSNVDTSGGG